MKGYNVYAEECRARVLQAEAEDDIEKDGILLSGTPAIRPTDMYGRTLCTPGSDNPGKWGDIDD